MNFIDQGEDQGSIFSEINVTPFVDVMLVLLIIFMITAPLMVETIKVNLPKGSGSQASAADAKPLILRIDSDGKLSIADNSFSMSEVFDFLNNNPRIKEGEPLYLEADGEIKHKVLVDVMSTAYKAGASTIQVMIERQ